MKCPKRNKTMSWLPILKYPGIIVLHYFVVLMKDSPTSLYDDSRRLKEKRPSISESIHNCHGRSFHDVLQGGSVGPIHGSFCWQVGFGSNSSLILYCSASNNGEVVGDIKMILL